MGIEVVPKTGVTGTDNLSSQVTVSNTNSGWEKVTLSAAGLVGATASGDAAIITLGTNLSFSGGALNAGASGGRTALGADTTWYVRTDGSDSNTGTANTAGGAFLTPQKAWDTVAALDLAGHVATIQIGDGTYNLGTNALVISKVPIGGGSVVVQGNAGTPANVILSTSGAVVSCTTAPTCVVLLKNFKITSSGANGIDNTGGGKIQISGINFGACAVIQANATNFGSYISVIGNYTISGAANAHIACTAGAQFNVDVASTITVTGTPAFAWDTVISQLLAYVDIQRATWSGSATGTRYSVSANAIIETNGGGASFIPGNAAGSASSGGIYV